jgi:hypothetical protein
MRTTGIGKDFAMELPDRPDLRHLRDQAKELVRSRVAPTLAGAQFQIARKYGFPSWPKLKHHVENLQVAGQLRYAIQTQDLERVKAILTAKPDLHRSPRDDGDDGPLSWVTDCRGPAPSPTRLAIAQWLIDHGSDVHQGGDGPLARSAHARCIPMMELLVANGGDVNGLWWGWFPVVFVPCENLDPVAIQWLLDHGTDPNRGNPKDPGTALDYVIGTYVRDPKCLRACIEILLAAGAHTRYDLPGVLPLLRGRNAELAALLDADPSLIHRRYAELDCGTSGGRMLSLRGATLLHVAAEFGYLDATRLLLDRGADANARADIDASGVGAQTPIFHALTHFKAVNPEVGELLIQRGADLTVRARVPGHYEHKGEILDVTAAEYAALFPLR